MIDARNYRASGVLTDGTPVTIRAIRPDDRPSILQSFAGLDRESVYTRFFTYKKQLTSNELTHITDVDFDRVVALVATTAIEHGEKLVGGGRYAVCEDAPPFQAAELAFTTGNAYRGRGLAPLLLKHLTNIGRARGLVQFKAEVLAQNRAMLSVFRRSGLPCEFQVERGVVHVTLALAPVS